MLAEANLGRDPLAEKQADRTVRRFDAFVEESYLPYASTYKASIKSDESLLRLHLLPRFGRKPINAITRNDIVMMHQARRNEGAAPATANRLVILMKFIFNLALKWEEPGVSQNPARGVRLFIENNQRERFLTAQEVQGLLAEVEKSSNPQLRYIIPMLVLTGARKREVLDARWADLDQARRFRRIPLSKSGKARHVPLSDGVLKLLALVPRLDDCPWVFANPETREPFADIFFPWNKARQAAGLPDVRIHDLRHSFASFLVNAGRSLYEVQKLLGHSQMRTTQRYAHLAPETLLDAANSASHAAQLELWPKAPAPLTALSRDRSRPPPRPEVAPEQDQHQGMRDQAVQRVDDVEGPGTKPHAQQEGGHQPVPGREELVPMQREAPRLEVAWRGDEGDDVDRREQQRVERQLDEQPGEGMDGQVQQVPGAHEQHVERAAGQRGRQDDIDDAVGRAAAAD